MTKVLFIAGNISVFDATPIKIYDYLKATSNLIEKPTLLAILDWRVFLNYKRKAEVKEIFRKANIPVKYTIRFFPISLLTIFLIYKFGKYDKVYANNLTAGINAYLSRKIFGIKYVFDFHGSIPEERVLIGLWRKDSSKYRIMKSMERKIASASTANVAISSTALEYLDCIKPDKVNHVIPCGINFDPLTLTYTDREELRRKLGIEEKFVVLYSGSLSPWNDYDKMATVLKALNSELNNFMLLILSKDDKSAVHEFVKRMGLENAVYLHLSLSHGEIQTYTAVADLALLIRKNSIVNQISSPMKFGEYIGAGVPVLISPGIGDASKQVEAYQLGGVVETRVGSLQSLVKDIQNTRYEYFCRNRKFAAEHYRLSAFLDKYQTLYNA